MAQTAQININVNAKQATDTVGQLNQELNQTTKSFNSMKAELRAITQELQGLDPGSERFKELSTRAGQLRDTISDTNNVINATAGNITENFGRALGSSIQLGVAGFQGLLSVQTLFGVENENLQKTLNQFGALLNLTQAIETFGGLSDKLTQIKAGFTPVLQSLGLMATTQTEVAVATGAADAALVGEAVAADGAAVSTGFFATALNALPLVAIVTALGLLVAGLISYSSASSDAEIQEKKRKKALEEEAKQIKKNNESTKAHSDFIVNESAAFIQLALQIKGSNKGSVERNKLLKQINSEYGTTLKNLSDEAAFQSQINKSIDDYLKLAEARYKLEQNEGRVKKLIAEKVKLEEASNKFAKIGFEQTYDNYVALGKLSKEYGMTQTEVTLRLQDVKKELNNITKSSFNLGNTVNDLSNNYKGNTGAVEDNNDALEKQKNALDKIKEELNRRLAAEEGLEDIQNKRLSRTSAQLSEELGLIEDFNKTQEDLIKQATQREIDALDEKFVQGLINEEEYIKGREDIQKGGLNNLLTSETDLLNAKRLLLAEDLENVKEKYALEGDITKQAITQIQDETAALQLQFQKEQEIDAITNSTLTEEKKQEAILDIKKKYLDEEIALIKLSAKNQIDALSLQKEKVLEDEQLTADERKQIEEKYNQDVLKINQNTQKQIQEATTETVEVQKTQVEKITESLDAIDDVLGAIQDVYSQFESAITNLTAANTEKRTQLIADETKAQTDILDTQLAARLITEEEYNNQKNQLEQQQEQENRNLAKKEFETNKKLNLVSATIDGARAVISTFGSTPGGLVIKSIAAGLAAAFAAIQIGVIKNSVFTAATGGIVPGTGSGDIDSVPANLAPGEAVINSRSTSRFLPVLSAINMAEGGRSLMPNLPSVNQGQTFQTVYSSNQPQQPIRAYVVESDVSDAQRRVQRIENSTRF